MSNTWLYSDPHFGHANVIRYAGRPFASVEEMDEVLERNYVAAVQPDDLTIWVGDCFFFNVERAQALMSRLPGRKVLVMGNHDRSKSWMARVGFDSVVEREIFIWVAGHSCRVCHYPYRGVKSPEDTEDESPDEVPETNVAAVRPNDPDRFLARRPVKIKGEILIHGHTHSKSRRINNMIHVGVDAWNFMPVAHDQIADLIEEIARV